RSRQAVLAGVLLALVFGLGAMTGSAFLGTDPRAKQPQASPGDPPQPETALVAAPERDKLRHEEQARTPGPVATQVVAPATKEPAPTASPRMLASLDRASPRVRQATLIAAPPPQPAAKPPSP